MCIRDRYTDDSIVGLAYHTHLPYTSTTYNSNDEIRIPINQQDVYTLPCESYLHIKLEYTNSNGIYCLLYTSRCV